MIALDPLNVPLQGLNLIEASAGTGKTYAICNIYVQLLIERGLTTGEILVVTFTRAATEELRGRVRSRIVDALNVFSGIGQGDDFLQGLAERTADKDGAKRRLINGLRAFDLAAIFTIHGFCLRVLHNHAFESASFFDTALAEDETDLIHEIVDDFWRKTFYPMDPDRFRALSKDVTRDGLIGLARKCLTNPFLAVVLGSESSEGGSFSSDRRASDIGTLRKTFIEYLRKEASRRKREMNIRSYDDLLTDLFRALEGPGGKELVGKIRSHYKAALVDEFQDTDPVQYAIFKAIYGGGEGTLFLIGDPKQSIYSFRGADIFSYMEAVGSVDGQFTLDKNWRSTGTLIKAVNTIFSTRVRPFVFESLHFQPVGPGEQSDSGVFAVDGVEDPAPFKIWFLEREEGKKNIAKGFGRTVVGKAVADEIVTLLSLGQAGRALIEGKPVHAGDIAILVPTNWEAREMLGYLRDAHVPGVIYSSESVFNSHEALEWERVLSAVLEPTNETSVRAALVTDMLGLSGDDLACLSGEEPEWDRWVEKFEFYRTMLVSRGFISMARAMITREGIKQRLRAFPDGERRVTNILHCVELLHSAATEKKLGPESLLKWLREKRVKEKTSETEEYQMRLETDERAVKIVTIHKSKGLEYPIVFCPFSWDAAEKDKSGLVVYHDKESSQQATLDISFPPGSRGKESMQSERLAELVRLVYVTLTRAKYRCYVAWGYMKDSETSALSYLFHYRSPSGEDVNLAAVKDFMTTLSDADMMKDLDQLVRASEGTIEVMPLPAHVGLSYRAFHPDADELTCRQFSAHIEKDWRTTSFTAIVSGKERSAEAPDRDKAIDDEGLGGGEAREESGRESLSFFDFPRGTRAGTCLHDIFEHIDFALEDRKEARHLVADRLAAHGFEERWTESVYDAVVKVLSVPILGPGNTFSLSHLSPAERLHEVGFYVPLEFITSQKLREVFSSHRGGVITDRLGEIIEKLGFKPLKGMLRGFIDMVFCHDDRFYLVDWKSNFLGNTIEDYRPERLNEVMAEELYILQYLIYAAALHKFLEVRVNDYRYHDHFGGVFYLFLRGMDPARGRDCGVFFDRPDFTLIDDFARCLCGGRRDP